MLRHDRLWSIAGISNILSRLNEIKLPAIVQEYGGIPIVVGGGKFTARFSDTSNADKARAACERHVATVLPMLEFQVTRKPYQAASFKKLAPSDSELNPAIVELNEQKRRFRGYSVAFNPHLKLCEECGEYPVQHKIYRGKRTSSVCRVCHMAFTESRDKIFDFSGPRSSLQRVYQDYLASVSAPDGIRPPADFDDLFNQAESGDKESERKRIAVWFSDLNNMNDKVPVWLNQENEDKVLDTFNQFRDQVVKIIVKALAATFAEVPGPYLPFRLVVAGGDDLCLVMAEDRILEFARNISSSLNTIKKELPDTHPLSDAWLKKNGVTEKEPKPFGFGASFVVTGVHTPFSQIHALGEELMIRAKKHTERRGNSVNWRIMAEDRPLDAEPFLFAHGGKVGRSFDRPLFIEKHDTGPNQLSFNDYLELRGKFKGKITGSHIHQIVGIMLRESDAHEIERQMKLLDSSKAAKSFSPLLRDKAFRNEDGSLDPARIATLFELLSIGGGEM